MNPYADILRPWSSRDWLDFGIGLLLIAVFGSAFYHIRQGKEARNHVENQSTAQPAAVADVAANVYDSCGGSPGPVGSVGKLGERANRAGKAAKVHMLVTAYCPCKKCCGPNARGVTASGNRVASGMCAADPRYPFGTAIDVPGIGRVIVQDRGGAIRGNHIDIYMTSHAEALRWGKRTLVCEVQK